MSKPHLTLEERIELEAALRAGDTQACIARRLERSAGTISREIALHGGRSAYRAAAAHQAAMARRGSARRGDCAIASHPPLREQVHARFHRGWSPEEIAGSLKADHPHDARMHTSHESIYRYVYIVARGELKRELVACLRRHHARRKPRRRGIAATQGQLKDMALIDQRPPEVESRLIAGHYEGDLILGAGNRSAVGVLVERTSRYTFLCHLPQKDATSVREAFTRKLRDIPAALRLSLTYDQGKEMAEHQTLAADLALKVFFCHAHSPWERATCESQNDRIRHYLPKGTDLSKVSYQQLSAYQEMLNERPRKILGWKSPAQCFHELIISTRPSN
ncbi:IS30 family transposase [Congregicoccus parvus]|uniref:IS30 family transposase n=1 Tax=Congregicoccus parvus TaxID=3081749 RepID=UPI003FA60F7E